MTEFLRRTVLGGTIAGLAAAVIPRYSKAYLGDLKFEARNKLNVLLITVDDMDWESTGLFNSQNAHITPHINQLGAEGFVFKHSHVSIAECWPSRVAINSGRYPQRNGSTIFKPMDDDIIVLPEVLQRAGYLTGLAGKTKDASRAMYGFFDRIWSEKDFAMGRSPEKFYEVTKSFIEQAKSEGRPFFLNLNSGDPHRPFSGSPDDRDFGVSVRNALEAVDPFDLDVFKVRPVGEAIFDPADVFVPGFLPDIDEVRDELNYYYSSVARADDSVGRIMDALANSGVDEQTLVVFLSDHGMHMPFAKANVYPFSTAASLVIRQPSLLKAPRLDDRHFISSIDIFPTILDILDIEPIKYLDGRSFKSILEGNIESDRDHCFTYRYQYPMRAIQSRKFSYIYNLWSDGKTSFQPFFLDNPTALAMRQHSESNEEIAARYQHFLYREKEELYDVVTDPYCLENLAYKEGFEEDMRRLRGVMHAHMQRTDDNSLYQYEQEIMT